MVGLLGIRLAFSEKKRLFSFHVKHISITTLFEFLPPLRQIWIWLEQGKKKPTRISIILMCMFFNITTSSQQLQEKHSYIMRKNVSILCFEGSFCVFSPGKAFSHSRQLFLANKNIHIVIRNCLDLPVPLYFFGCKMCCHFSQFFCFISVVAS